MKKNILIVLFTIANVSFTANAALRDFAPRNIKQMESIGPNKNINILIHNENVNYKLILKRIVCATAATASLAAFVPALISDLKALPETAQAEVPLCLIPMCTFLLSCLMYE